MLGAFSLVEILVSIGIVAVLIAILLPVLGRVREHSRRSACASNLHRLGQAFAAYASENRGWIPRHPLQGHPMYPLWQVRLAKFFRHAPLENWADIATIKNYQCPSHPISGIPTAYVINAFAFETRDEPHPWDPSPMVSAGRMKSPAALPLLLEAGNSFGGPFPGSVLDPIYYESGASVHSPEHLPGGREPRVAEARHVGKSSNVLFADGHTDLRRAGEFRLEEFDDGIRERRWK